MKKGKTNPLRSGRNSLFLNSHRSQIPSARTSGYLYNFRRLLFPPAVLRPQVLRLLPPQVIISSSSTSLQIFADSNTKSVFNPLYYFLPRIHNPYNIVGIICSHLKHNNGHLTSLREDLKWVLPHLDAHDVSRVLLLCQSDHFAALNFFNWVKNDLGFTPTSQNYCIIVHILVWSQNFAQSMKLLSELIKESSAKEVHPKDVFRDLVLSTEGCNWDPVVFDMLSKAYLKLGMVREGLISFQKTVKIGFVPNVSVCNCLLNGLLKLNKLDCCWEIYEEMGRIGIFPNSYTFNILTHVLCRNGDVDKVNVFLEKMEEEGFDPDVVTYNTLIDSYCRKGRLDDAFYLYKIMYRRGVPPDLVSYTTLMKGFCNKGKVREAHQLFHRMIHRGLSPDIVSFNSLISGYCKQGKMQESRSLLHEMIQSGILPDDFTCHTLIKGYVNAGRLLSALNLIVELKRLGVLIPSDIYCWLIMALCQENRPNAAVSLFRRMSQDGYEPSLEIYNILIGSFCKDDGLQEAFLLKDEMICKGPKPDLNTYRALIGCLCRLCKSAEAESLMCEMVASGLFPDSVICRALINGFCKEEDLDKAESLLTYFSETGDGSLIQGFLLKMTSVCPFTKAARPDDACPRKVEENSNRHQTKYGSKVKEESDDSAIISPKCPFGYDSHTFKLGPLSCMICQALLFESSKCFPCSHKYCKACISHFKDCPLCGADIEKIEPDKELQDVVDRFIDGHARIKRPQLKTNVEDVGMENKTVIYEDVSIERGAFLVQQAMRAFRAQNIESAKSRLNTCAEDIREQLERLGHTSELCSQLGAVLGMLGDCCRAMGDAASAITYFKESVDFLSKLPMDDLEVTHTLSVSLNKIGDLKYYDGDLQDSRSYYSRSLDVRRNAIKDRSDVPSQTLDVAVSLAKVADVDRNLGNEDLAIDEFEEAIKCLKSLTLDSNQSALEQRRLSVLDNGTSGSTASCSECIHAESI
ncbi:hypothetical protein NE237_005700 [Protea cynaroides]|uniref:RING-type domain-containing protein n=1 Tax=Protea cynaroides TaxID=273540 RepID=A0A9Q0KLQ5_9MAGN|nr:hypothetical protein NE237_005700 [Protea cynaroides]